MQGLLYAAIPWVLMALMAALMYVFTKRKKAREAEKRQAQTAQTGNGDPEQSAEQDNRMMEGMCIGSALGLCLGPSLGRPLLCVCFFMLLGMFIGSNVKKYQEK